MKIEETCDTSVAIRFADIPLGTVFKFRSGGCLGKNLFLKLACGVVNLTCNTYYSQTAEVRYEDYTPFPAARVVLK